MREAKSILRLPSPIPYRIGKQIALILRFVNVRQLITC